MSTFYSRLSYSFGNEDWVTEQKALRITPQDRVMCITASGDRPLHLLMNPCREMISIDANPIQNHLLSLKCAALSQLPNEEYLGFLGAKPHSERLSHYRHIKHALEKEARSFWDGQESVLHQGVLYAGAMERWCKRLAFCFRILRGKKIRELFSHNDIHKQELYIDKSWNTPLLKLAFKFVGHKWVLPLILKDPGLYAFIDSSYTVSGYLYDRIENSLKRHLAKENPLLSLLLLGKVPETAMPPYLTPEGADRIRSNLHALRWQNIDLLNFLENAPSNSIDCYSLSDVASYISPEEFTQLTRAMVRTARPGARFAIRQCMSCHSFPEELAPYFERNHSLEQELEQEDRCFVYRFFVGTIHK